MSQRLTPSTLALLLLPPVLWAGNAIVGRLLAPLVPPMTLNLLRWLLAFAFLLPLAPHMLRRSSPLWTHWRRFSVLGLLSIAGYNSLQYLALQTSSPINATLVASSIPVWMLILGHLFFKTPIRLPQLLGAALSVAGVLVVLCRGQWALLQALHLVPGDLYMLLAALVWALYSWLLALPREPLTLRQDWAAFLLGQITLGLGWSALLSAGEWTLTNAHIVWSWPLLAALLFVALGPALLAYRCWGAGVQRVGPSLAGFFANLTPLLAALFSSALLGEAPQLFHGLAFVLIVGGIVVSSRR